MGKILRERMRMRERDRQREKQFLQVPSGPFTPQLSVCGRTQRKRPAESEGPKGCVVDEACSDGRFGVGGVQWRNSGSSVCTAVLPNAAEIRTAEMSDEEAAAQGYVRCTDMGG